MPLAAGNYLFRAVYGGDDNYVAGVSDNYAEPLTVNRAAPTVTTLLSQTVLTWGSSVTDSALVTGLEGQFPVPTGSVTFWVSYDTVNWFQFGGTVSLVDGSAGSASYLPASFAPALYGIDYFKAVYSGDSNYVGGESGVTEEPLIVNSMTPGTTGNYIISAVGVSGQSGFLTNNTYSPLSPYGKVNPQLSNGHPSTSFHSDVPVPTILTRNIISVRYFMQTTMVSNVPYQTIQCSLSFTYEGKTYPIGTVNFNATAAKGNPPPTYYVVNMDVTGKSFVAGLPVQTIPTGSIITLKTTLINPNNRADLFGGIAGTQITLF
jgi:hypothetical protein